MNILYNELIKNYKYPEQIRLEMVRYALKHGIKPTSREYKTTPKTVRKWVKLYMKHKSRESLKNKSRARITQSNKISNYWRLRILQYANKAITNNKRLKASYLKQSIGCKYSLKTIIKVLRQEGIWKKRQQKKHDRKKDLRNIKMNILAFMFFQIDIKYLDDIPEFFRDYYRFKFPKYQITARCVKTGALYIAYATEKTVTNTTLFLDYLCNHLKANGVDLSQIKIQTDNGYEFRSPFNSKKDAIFTKYIKAHCRVQRFIPPGACTYNSDVETSHRLIEEEFYSQKYFSSKQDILRQAEDYINHFNLKRDNGYKGGTPWDIMQIEGANFSKEILKLAPIIIDERIDELTKINKSINNNL